MNYIKAPYILLITSAIMLILGIMNGEAASTLRKAISICLSCIGIG